jgi:hypothetical protein
MGNGHFSRVGMFTVGFFTGILVVAVAGLFLVRILLRNPQAVIAKLAVPKVAQIVQKTVATAPREYIGEKQDDIAVTAQAVARAYSENRITPDDMQDIGTKVFSVMADQRITPQEIDEVLRMLKEYAGEPSGVSPEGNANP